MSNIVMSFNQEEAEKASGSSFVTDGGAYSCKITKAKFVEAGTGSKGMEFSVDTDDGLKANYLTVYYKKADGSDISGGKSCINAMMGMCGLSQITAKQVGTEAFCPEFEGRRLGLFLNKKLYTKSDGTDGFKFEIRVPYDPVTMKTTREKLQNQPAKTIESMLKSYKDIDERTGDHGQPSGNYSSEPPAYSDEDIPGW